MFTKNYYKALSVPMETSKRSYIRMNGGAYDGSYGNYHVNFCSEYQDAMKPSMRFTRTSLEDSGGAIFGTGDTPPTIDDYNLSGELITTFTASAAYTSTADDTGFEATSIYTITNTGSEEFTIKEVALICSTSSGNTSQGAKAMFERTVLDTPITIPAGGIGQVTYTIRFNYPTA